MTLPDLEAWAVFARVAETGSFAAASADLGLSTATVSKAVARLERQVGAALLSRTSRRMALTTVGRELADRAALLLADAERLEADALDRTATPRGLVRIAVPMSFGQLQVAPLLPGLLRRYPGLSIDLHLGDELVDLVGGGFDFALRIAPLQTSSLRSRRIRDVRLLLVASSAYAGRLPAHPRELQELPCFGYAYQSTASRWLFGHASGEQAVVAIAGPLRANNAEAVMPSLLAGLGLAVLPDFMAWREIEAGRLVRVLPDWSLPASPLSLVMPPTGLRPARVVAALDFFHQALASAPWSPGTRRAGGVGL